MTDSWWIDQDELDDDQKAVISLPLEGSYLIVGPPGCGKTNLLLLRAKYMSMAGLANLSVIVFTRTLREFLLAGGRQYSFSPSKIQTCRKWQQELLKQYGVPVEPPQDFEKQRMYFLEQIRNLISTKRLANVYDAILLDEAQDYLPEEIQTFRKLARTLFAVAHSKQKIYAIPDCMEELESQVSEKLVLKFHYRIGVKICKIADALAKDTTDYEGLSATSNYNEASRPSSVEHFRCRDIEDQADRIIEKLSLQLKAYPDELLGVVCPTIDELMRVWDRILKSPLSQFASLQVSGGHSSFELGRNIIFSTLHGSKGIEVRAMHIASCEFLRKFPYQRNMAFTAVTRTKTSLTLYYSDDIPGYLERALASLQPLPDLPKLGDVFGRTN